MGGRLNDIAPDASETVAQAALMRLVEDGYGRPIEATWQQTDADWWAAEDSFAE